MVYISGGVLNSLLVDISSTGHVCNGRDELQDLEEQKLRQAILFGAQLIKDAGIGDYKIKLHNKRRTLADCNPLFRVIRYSKHFVRTASKDEFEGVTLHEIAHALVGAAHGHDGVFKAKCRELGAEERFIATAVKGVGAVPKYTLTCSKCKSTNYSNIKKRYICGVCNLDGVNSPLVCSEIKVTPILW